MPVTTLPTVSRNLDNAFMTTWQEIKEAAIDNITQATPIMAALKLGGCLVPQNGGDTITRSIDYALPTSQVQGVGKGSVMATGEIELRTMARWPFRNYAIPIQRDLFTDRENSGPTKIADYVAMKLKAARRALVERQSTDLLRAQDTTEVAHMFMQSLNDLVPSWSSNGTVCGNTIGTWGLINRPLTYDTTSTSATYGKPVTGNTWWGPMYNTWTGPKSLNMVNDMTHLFYTIMYNSQDQAAPDLIVCTQADAELYENAGIAMSQIVKSSGGLFDLGFDVIKFKGADMVVTQNTTVSDIVDGLYQGAGGSDMLFLTKNRVELVYDSGLWFEMDEWVKPPREFTRITKIIARCNTICAEPRKLGRLQNATTTRTS